ncbi:MAG: NPCBM/NEW2 domain-containing protein [Clostridiales bacterium]|nr:NPCBM/NEW2 domain-containing protein [Clostridiales bacterium]
MNTQIRTRQKYLNGNGYSDWGGLDASDRIGGYFLWSWNDYTRGSTTATLGSGTVDIDRYEKNCYYWLQSMQPADNEVYGPMVYISSDYTADSSLTVPVYSNCDSVKLYQNGTLVKEITREEAGKNVPNIMKKGGSPIFEFNLQEFAAGTLKAEGIVDGNVVTEYEVRTPEEAVAFELEVRDRGVAPVADGSDLIPVHIKAVDKNGTIVPNYDGTVHVDVSGNGTLVGENIPRIKVEDQKLEKGIGFAFVKASDVAGDITITATADGMENGTKTVVTKASEDTFVPNGEDRGWADGEDVLEDPTLENIAAGKQVKASSEQTGNAIGNIVDDDEATRWCASGGGFPQWVEVDLGQATALAGFQMLWENSAAAYQYTIEVSNDGIHWNTVLDKTDNTTANTSQETQMVKTAGRFVRLNITGANEGWASLFEFRIVPDRDAEPVAPGEEIPDDVIKSFVASEGSVDGREPELVRDGETNIGTGWLSPSPKIFPQTLEMHFTEPQTLLGSAIWWEKDSTKITYDIQVLKAEEKDWTTVMENLEETWHDEEPETFGEIQENVTALRVVIRGKAPADTDLGMAEWKVYGYTYEEPDPEPEKEFEYASNLAWERAHSDYGEVKKDGAAYGGKLVLNTEEGPKTFDKGLGADTNSYVIYNVEGKKYYKFESYIGINKNAGKQGGEAIFKVYVDDELKYTSPVKMRDDNCEFISVEIPENAKTVKLEAVWSGNTENPEARYNTHVDWADARFFIKPTTYQIVAESEDEEMGTVSLDHEDGIYNKGTKAVATANEGYEFVGWANADSDEIISEEAVYEFYVKENVHLIAKFKGTEAVVDKSNLDELISYAKSQQTKEEYKYLIPVVKTAFEKALAEADAVNGKADATQEEVNTAYENLLKMVHMLDFTGNSESLKVLVDAVKGLNEKLYTQDSWNVLKDALKKAEDVLADENALQKEIDAARDALQSAMDNLVKISVDKSKLQKLVDQSKKYEDAISEYTPATAEIFQGVLEYARSILVKEDATQEEIDAAYAALQNAIFGLRLIPDKDKLDELIKEAEKTDFSKYKAESGNALKTALAHAKAVFADENATENDVKSAEKELKTAMKGLKLVSNDGKDDSKDEGKDNNGNNNGGTSGNKTDKNAPKTGDYTTATWLLAMAAAVGVIFFRKRKSYK